MSPKDKWVVTWPAVEAQERTLGASIVHRRDRRAFDSQMSAVSFVMSLDKNLRQSAQLELPGGQKADFPSIERMNEAQKLADQK